MKSAVQNIKLPMSLKKDIQRYLNGEGYYNWGIELLIKLKHDPIELRKLQAFCRDTYAPSWAEQRIVEILRGTLNSSDYYGTAPWQNTSGWIEVAQEIPKVIQKMQQNQFPTSYDKELKPRILYVTEDLKSWKEGWDEVSDKQMHKVLQEFLYGNEFKKAYQQEILNRPPDEPEVITVLREEVKIRLKARADWHAQMKATPRAEEKRKAHCAEQIMTLTDELEKRYILLNNWRDNHILPPLVSTKVTASDENAATELAQIVGDISTIAPRVSKIKGILKKKTLTDERRQELTEELNKKDAELKILRAKSLSFKK